MRAAPTAIAAAAATTTTTEISKWNSPVPYLFGGLAVMLLLIAVALTILACSYKISNLAADSDEKPARPPVPVMQPEMEPKIVVIMAGDENPTYLAKPVKAINVPLF